MGEANRLGRSGVLAAAVLLVVGVLVLAAVAQPAKAAFPGQNGDIAYAKFSPSSEEARIFTMNPDGSEQTLLEPGSSPSYSPNGAQVVFERFIGDGEEEFNQDIYVVDSEGTSGPVQVTSGPAYDHSPTFLDNDTVAFIRDSRRNGTDIFKKQIGVPGAENLTNTPVMYEETLAATFNGTDAKIAFTRYNRSSDIFIMNDDGSEVTNLTRTGRIDEYDPDWSPDAQKITFTSYPFGRAGGEQENADISVMNAADGSERKDLTDGPAFEDSPVFSPDGTRIAFCKITFSRTRGERGDIFTMKADGTGTRRVTDTRAFEYEPAWQPTDGSVAATGTLQSQGITTYQYGDFVLTDEATGQLYAVRASGVDLSALVGQRVTVNGTLVPGYESGQVEDGPPLLDVTQVDPL